MHEQTLYHLRHFPIEFLLTRFFPRAYGMEAAPSHWELPLERDDAQNPFWRTYRLPNDGSHVRDLRAKMRAFRCLKVHAGLPLDPGDIADEERDLKPLVLDIDLDEETYREGLPCECQRGVCEHCWFLVVVRLQVARYVLRNVFGFEKHQIKVLFSGRRGVHIWVLGRVYPVDVRDMFLKRFRQLGKRGKHEPCKHTAYIYERIILPMWERHFVPLLDAEHEPVDRETLFERFYPELDEPVIKQPKHAVGCPLSTHKRTGNIIQPILPGQEHTFQPVHCRDVTPELMRQWCHYLMR